MAEALPHQTLVGVGTARLGTDFRRSSLSSDSSSLTGRLPATVLRFLVIYMAVSVDVPLGRG